MSKKSKREKKSKGTHDLKKSKLSPALDQKFYEKELNRLAGGTG